MFISVDSENPEIWYLMDAVRVLQDGGVIAYPTDTVYGFGCDLFNREAIDRIYQLKRISRKKPLSFICADLTHIAEFARVSNIAYRMMKRLLPGPYTFILPATHKVPRLMLTKRRTVGIRVPDNKICYELVTKLGNPIISTSVELRDDDPVSDPFKIYEEYSGKLDAVIDGGLLKADVSTIIDLSEREPVLVRQGKGDVSGIF